MYEIDKHEFGAFIAQLRREKGYTQKELAEKLFISDKAVSKWETGVSIPDTSMLVPLSELLGVTVTELLSCERAEADGVMAPDEVERIVKTAVSYPGEKTPRAWQHKSLWWLLYPCAFILGLAGMWYIAVTDIIPGGASAPTVLVLAAIFGAYFCFLVKTQLPGFYDETRFGLYYDNFVRMNIPGLALNNRNWPHIVRVVRVWCCLMLALYPLLIILMSYVLPQLAVKAELYVCLVCVLGGMFLPVYIVGKKYE